MIDQLNALVKEYASDAIITNPAIPNDRNDEAVGLASSSILDGLKKTLSGGNADDLKNIFSKGEQNISDEPVTQNIKGNFVENLVKKFGLDHGKAGQIASALIPVVMSKFIKKTNDPTDSTFDLSSMIGSLSGGGIGDLLGKFTGGGNTDNSDSKQGDGGLMDKVKGMFN